MPGRLSGVRGAGAVAAHAPEIEAVLKQYPRDVDVVIYNASRNKSTATK
jgi:hypothetical protein